MANFIEEILVPFHLIDGAGILFYGHAFTLAHQAYEKFVMQALHSSWENWFQNNTWAVPIKSSEAVYHFPILGGKACTIQMEVAKIGRSSFCLESHLLQENMLCCVVKTTHVFISKASHTKMPIPHEFLIALSKFCQEESGGSKEDNGFS